MLLGVDGHTFDGQGDITTRIFMKLKATSREQILMLKKGK